MTIANVHEAKTNLSKLLDDAAEGKEVVITRRGGNVTRFKLTPVQPGQVKRAVFGAYKGRISFSSDYDAADEEITELLKKAPVTNSMVLLDTNVLLWFFVGDERLSENVRKSIENDPGNYLVSTVSFWEIAIKRQIGKLTTDLDMPRVVKGTGFITLDMVTAHVYEYESLPLIHRDPFDRMLIAQSKTEHLPLLTGDLKLKEYDVKVINALV